MIVKVCGMRETDNIRAVEACGIDWMGFIFYDASSRFVDTKPSCLPETVKRVGVFVNTEVETILQTVMMFGLDIVQLHGTGTSEICRVLKAHGITVIKAISIRCPEDILTSIKYDGVCDYFLFDTHCATYGGSGRSFDWSILADYDKNTPFLLSGGITPAHLDALRSFHHPKWVGIDLNSGFEIKPAVKDPHLLQPFIDAFRAMHPY